MNNIFSFYVFILFATSVIGGMVGYLAWKRRTSLGAMPLVILTMGISAWALFQALVFIVTGFNAKAIMANLRYLGIETAPLAFYALAWEYKDRTQSINKKRLTRMILFPLICLVALWTNGLHHLFYLRTALEDGILILENGPLFWINMAYLYGFILTGVYLFVRAYVNAAAIYKKQAVIIVISAFIPILANLAFNFEFLPFKDIDITPISLLITGILFFYALFYYKLLDVVPIARDLLVEEMDDIVIVLDSQKRILDLNKRARDFILSSTVASSDYAGKSILPMLDNWQDLARSITNSDSTRERIIHSCEEGTEFYDMNKSNIYDKKGSKIGALIILRNVTELEGALRETQKAKEAAEQANTAKGYFLANMSHEIRTPLNAVIGIADILDTADLPKDKQKYYIKLIHNSAESLLTIINDILDFSKIEAGKIEMEKNPFNLKELVQDIVETFAVTNSGAVRIHPHIDGEIADSLLGDMVRVKQILMNLIANAVKFTKEGSIDVTLQQLERTENGSLVGITVADTGIGIPADKLGSIFESFKQADSSTTRKYGGTGLGLSIVKSLLELMGGSIMVESEPGKGSRFCLRIPFETASAGPCEKAQPAETAPMAKDLTGMRILVADDNKTNREIISLYLKNLSCVFDLVENGMMALEKLEQKDYDVILMDVQMPEMDGLEAARRIRAKERLAGGHIPIIALTAGAMQEDVAECLQAGMDAHLSKPVKAQKLRDMLLSAAGYLI